VTGLTLLLGGVRAGKSARAVSLAVAEEPRGDVLFVATAQALDDEMRRRIDAHRRERSPRWTTLESPLDLAGDIAARLDAAPPHGAIVIDCLTLWVSNLLMQHEAESGAAHGAENVVADRTGALLDLAMRGDPATAHPRWIIVSNEVGLGVVPPTPLGRAYRDALGRANQLVAAAADDVVLMVAGLELPLRRRG
jgi:adenosylcobinamide kinase/adenosylcobinamide-phosphate guanylyltransferase